MRAQRSARRAKVRNMVAAALITLLAPVARLDAAGATAATTKKATAPKAIQSPLPVMNVTDVKTGKQVALASTFDGTKPMLIWFWAPH